MPLKIAPEDRKLAIGVGAVLALSLVLAIFIASTDSENGGQSSSYSAGNSGTKAAFLLLEQMGYSSKRWTEDPRRLSQAPPHATLILADPLPTDESDIEAVRQFLRNGGRVLAAGESFAPFLPKPPLRPGTPHFQWRVYRPSEPSALTRGIREIELAPKLYFDPERSEAPFREGDESPITRIAYGSGEVIWWSTSEPISNSGIREKDNVQLLLNSVGDPGRGPVLWDEFFHQGRTTLVDTLMASPLRWGLAQGALIGALLCLTYSRRFGPVRSSVAASRLAPMEFVETLAALYQKTGAAHVTVEIVYERFRAALQHRFSLPTGADAAQVADVIVNHLPGEDLAETARMVCSIEQASADPELRSQDATSLVGVMHRWSSRLKLKAGGLE